MALFQVDQRVFTEFGIGTVKEVSPRRVFIVLDNGESINLQTGTHGYDRLVAHQQHREALQAQRAADEAEFAALPPENDRWVVEQINASLAYGEAP